MKAWLIKVVMVGLLLSATWHGTRIAYRSYATAQHGPLACREASYDFGVKVPGSIIEHTFTIENFGSEPVRLIDSKTSCSCSVAALPELPIPPGGEAAVKVSVDTTGDYGPLLQEVYLFGDEQHPAPIKLTIKGDVHAPWTPVAHVVEFEYESSAEERKDDRTEFQLRISELRPGVLLEPTELGLPGYLKVGVTRTNDRVFTVSVDPQELLLPEKFQSEITLADAAGRYPEYRFTVKGGVRTRLRAVPPKVIVHSVGQDTPLSRDVRIVHRVPPQSEPDNSILHARISEAPEGVKLNVRLVQDGEKEILLRLDLLVSASFKGDEGRAVICVEDTMGCAVEVPMIFFFKSPESGSSMASVGQ